MISVTQRLPLKQALYNIDTEGKTISISDIKNYTPTWTPSLAVIDYSIDGFFISNNYVMSITPTNPSSPDITLTLNVTSSFSANDAGALFVAHGQFKCDAPNYSTSIQLKNSTDDAGGSLNRYPYSTSNTPKETEHLGGVWSAARSNVMAAPVNSGSATFTLIITISNYDNETIYFTSPAIVVDNFWVNSPALINMRRYMPDFYWEKDSLQTEPQNPFFRFIDVATYQISSSMQMYSEWFQLEESELNYDELTTDTFTKSKLTYPEVAQVEYTDWLAQFTGVPVTNDIAISNVSYIDNLDEFRIWQLRNAYYGRASGTAKAIKESIKKVLTGTKTVAVTPGGSSEPWVIKVVTLTGETPSSPAVVRAAELARPLGYSIDHETVAELSFTLGNFPAGILGTAELG